MKHYICTGGCKGVSDQPGTCQTQSCPKYEKPLKECSCTDGKHEGVKKKNKLSHTIKKRTG